MNGQSYHAPKKTELKRPPGRGILYMWYGKPFALAPLDIAEAWNNLHPDEPPLDIVWD